MLYPQNRTELILALAKQASESEPEAVLTINPAPTPSNNIENESDQIGLVSSDKILCTSTGEQSSSIPCENSSKSSSSSSSNGSSGSSSSSSCSDSSFSEDNDYDVWDKDYVIPTRNQNSTFIIPSSSRTDSDSESSDKESCQKKIVRKRKGQPNLWSRNFAKRMRNSGKQYITKSKKIVGKKVGPACSDQKCQHKCSSKITDEERKVIFGEFWKTGDLQSQREFVLRCMDIITPKYRYQRENSNRKPNNVFYLITDGVRKRVCKVFFRNPLAITDRFIRTIIEKRCRHLAAFSVLTAGVNIHITRQPVLLF